MAKNLIRAPESLSVWESNIKELKKRQPVLAKQLEEYVEKNGHHFEHWENETPTGTWIEGLTEQPFFQSAEKPKFPWDKKKDKTDPTFFLYGVGMPPFLFQTIRSLPKQALSLVVIEPSMRLLAYTLHHTHGFIALPEVCSLTFYSLIESSCDADLIEKETRLQKELLAEALNSGVASYGIFTAVLAQSMAHPGLAENNEETNKSISAQIREWVSVRLSSLGNSPEDTLLGLRQMALMTPWLLHGSHLSTLQEAFKGRPCICVAAGPSLDKNVHLLKDVQDKCLLLAVDAVLRKLIENGIRPHIVTALERGITTYDCFFADIVEDYPDECSQITLIAQSVCVPQIAGRWPGPKIVLGKKGLPVDDWFNGAILHRDLLISGSSVAHMNYALANLFSAPAVALIGQDLAFGEDGSTHAGNTAREDVMEKTKKSSERLRLPGALGGEVESEGIWLFFLRVLEELIASAKLPTWDCTEGGALIAGTKIAPLQEYLDAFVTEQEPMKKTPGEVLLEQPHSIVEDEALATRFERAFKGLNAMRELLHEMQEGIQRTAAPAIPPDRRVREAAKVGQLLDKIHEMHAVLAFIGQSYVYLGSIELSKTRLLDTVESVEKWGKMHQEIVDSHRIALDFMERWLRYADAIRHHLKSTDFISPVSQNDAVSALMELVDKEEDGQDISFDLDMLLARCDFSRVDTPPFALWKVASRLMHLGRAQEASRYMKTAAERFEGQVLPQETLVLFFKEYAQMLASHDLCHMPDYAEAETVLNNALALDPNEESCRQLFKNILDARLSFSRTLLGRQGVPWLQARAVAAQSLIAGDLPLALSSVWGGIRDHWREIPGWAASHLIWLLDTLVSVRHAQDPAIRQTVESIVEEIISDGEILDTFRMKHAQNVVEFFAERGVKLWQPEEETKDDTEEKETQEATTNC